MTPRRAQILLAAIAVIAAVEWVAAASAYRTTLGPRAWERAAAAIAALPAHEPVLLGTPWLGPLARRHVPALAASASLAPPDLVALPRFHVLGHAGSPASGAWSDELAVDLAELPAPILTASDDLGPLVLHHYTQPAARVVTTDFLAAPLQLSVDGGDRPAPCRLSSGTWSCKPGSVTIRLVEVAYRPRRCLAVQLEDGATLEISLPRAALGTALRGHLGFGDFNGRLRNDAPALLEILVDDALAARWTISDDQGWAAFEATTTPGEHAVRVRLTPLLTGTWSQDTYGPAPPRLACLELRALAEAAP